MSKKNPPATQPEPSGVLTQAKFQSFSSPYPLPQQLEAFERWAPGSAAEVMATSQEVIRHNLRMQALSVQGEVGKTEHMNNTIRWVMLLGLVGGFVLVLLDKSAASYVFLFGEFGALAAAFLYGRLRSAK